MQHDKPRRPSSATALSLLALFVALGGTAFAAADASRAGDSSADRHAGAIASRPAPAPAAGPVAGVAKALGSRKLSIASASVIVPGNPQNANYNSSLARVVCPPGKVALSVSTHWNEFRDHLELSTVSARITVDAKGRPKGGEARGASNVPGDRVFTVYVLCAG